MSAKLGWLNLKKDNAAVEFEGIIVLANVNFLQIYEIMVAERNDFIGCNITKYSNNNYNGNT